MCHFFQNLSVLGGLLENKSEQCYTGSDELLKWKVRLVLIYSILNESVLFCVNIGHLSKICVIVIKSV